MSDVRCIEEGTVESTLSNSFSDLRSFTHLGVVEGNASEVGDDGLVSILLQILINSSINQISNSGLSLRNDLRDDSRFQ